MTVEFEIEGQKFVALNGGPIFKFNEAISFQVHCETQKEVDYYWEKLSETRAEKSFLNELKSQFEREIDLRETLDSKAHTMMTLASGTITVNIALGTFLLTRIADTGIYLFISIVILGAGLGFGIVSILKLIRSYGLRDYHYPMGHEHFYENGKYDAEMVQQVKDMKEEEFNDRLFSGYLDCIKHSTEQYKSKGDGVKMGQLFLVSTLVAIAVLVGFVLISRAFGLISLQ